MLVSFYWSSYLLKNFCVSNPDWRRLFWNVELCWTFWKVGLSLTLLNNFSFSKFSITDHENLTTKNQKVQCSWRVFSTSSYLFFSCFWIVCWFCSNAICGKKLQISYRVLSEYNTNFTALVNKEMYGSHKRESCKLNLESQRGKKHKSWCGVGLSYWFPGVKPYSNSHDSW